MTPAEIIAAAKEKAEGARKAKPAPKPVDTEVLADAPPEIPNLDTLPAALRPIVETILPFLGAGLNEARLRALVDHAVLRLVPRPTSIIIEAAEKGETKDLGLAHRLIPRLIELVQRQAWVPQAVFLVGPAGSAKTHAAEQVAQALGLACYIQSVGPQTSKSDLVGFVDAHGKAVWTGLRRAYTDGGLFALDEIDSANAGVLITVNAILSQSAYLWPDGVMTPKHPNFRIIAAGNTYGRGATAEYIGRTQLDGATLNRFRVIEWDYDEELEKALALAKAASVPNRPPTTDADVIRFVAKVQSFRKGNEAAKLRYIRSPRQVMAGAVDLARGDSLATVEQEHIWHGVNPEDRERILSHS